MLQANSLTSESISGSIRNNTILENILNTTYDTEPYPSLNDPWEGLESDEILALKP